MKNQLVIEKAERLRDSGRILAAIKLLLRDDSPNSDVSHQSLRFRKLCENYQEIGKLRAALSAATKAHSYHKKSLSIDSDNLNLSLDVASILRLRGDIFFVLLNNKLAIADYEESLDICSEVISNHQAPDRASADLACCWSRLSDVEFSKSNYDIAVSHSSASFDMCKTVCKYGEQTELEGDRERLIIATLKLAQAQLSNGDHSSALATISDQKHLMKYASPQSMDINYSIMAEIESLNKNPVSVKAYLIKCVEISSNLLKEKPYSVAFMFNYLLSAVKALRENCWRGPTRAKILISVKGVLKKLALTDYRTKTVKRLATEIKTLF